MYSLIAATFTRAHSVAASLAAVESTSPMPPSTQPSPSPPNLHLHRARLESAAGIASSPVRDPRYRYATAEPAATLISAALTTTSHLICRRAHRCPPQTVAAALAAAALAATVLTTAVLATTALATTSSRAFRSRSYLADISLISSLLCVLLCVLLCTMCAIMRAIMHNVS